MKKIVYRNIEIEKKTVQDLETSRAAMQNVLNEWLRLGLGPCMGLNDLVLRPRAVYDRAVDEIIKIPELSGPFKMDPRQYRDQLVLPDPSALYDACKQALRLPYCAMHGIFIVNDDMVELDQETASDLINSQTLYASEPDKIKRIDKVLAWIELTNSLNADLSGDFLRPTPATTQFCRGRFKITDKTVKGVYQYEISVDPEFIKQL